MGDPVSRCYEQINLIKGVLAGIFPNVTGQITATHVSLNNTILVAPPTAMSMPYYDANASGAVAPATLFGLSLLANKDLASWQTGLGIDGKVSKTGDLTAPPLAVQAISFSASIGGSDLGGAASSDPSSISRTFSGPQPVNAISVTAGDPSTAPMYCSIQYSDDGGLWTTAWELPLQATWSTGETRVFSIQPAPATGSVDPDRPLSYLTFFDGGDEVRVSIANAA